MNPGERSPEAGEGITAAAAGAAEVDHGIAERTATAAVADRLGAQGQVPSDPGLGEGEEAAILNMTSALRDSSAAEYRKAARERLQVAAARDAIAQRRDAIALARDQVAAARDARALADAMIAVRGDHASSKPAAAAIAAARTSVDEVQARAAADRVLAARDREQAARERLEAHADIEALLLRLAITETDAVSGIRARLSGVADLQREIDRARRTSRRLVIACIAVAEFKAVTDAYGPAAGEALLQRALRTIRRHLRSYDSIVRLGGGEFLCMMPGARTLPAHQRLAAIRSILATGPDRCEITLGFAELNAHDGAVEVIRRAETDLTATRRLAATTPGRRG